MLNDLLNLMGTLSTDRQTKELTEPEILSLVKVHRAEQVERSLTLPVKRQKKD